MIRIRNLIAFIAVAGMAALAPVSAAAQSQLGPYLAFGAGFDRMPDRNLDINGHTVNSQWKNGWGLLTAIGYKWFFGLRTEAEFSGRVSWLKSFNHVNPWEGTQWDNSLMFNALYDFEFGSRITPFIGGGIGGTQIQWGNNVRNPTNPTTIYDAESIRLGWQGIGGLTFAVTPKIALVADYRIKGATGGFGFPGSTPGKLINNFHYETRSIFLSVRYAFSP
jgi:OOP family OmpA-OmpF porin